MREFKGKLAVLSVAALLFAAAGTLVACGEGGGESSSVQWTQVQSISITGAPSEPVDISVGTVLLGLEYTPEENVEEFSVNWHSNAQSVATIDESGLLTLHSAGRTTVTASVIGNEKVKDSVTIEVTGDDKVEVTSVTITGKPENNRVFVGSEAFSLGYEYLPADADDFAVEWYSSTSSVATVDKDGLVTPVGEGVTTIRVTVRGTAVKDEFALIVGDTQTVESVKIIGAPENGKLRAGVQSRLTYTFAPENSAYFLAEWESSDPAVATIDETGLITALKEGTTTVSLVVADTQIGDSFELTVTPALDPLCEDFEYVSLPSSSGSGNYEKIENNYEGVSLSLTESADEVPAGGSEKALKVSTSSASWAGVNLTPRVMPEEGKTYVLSVDVRLLSLAEGTESAALYCNIKVNGSNLEGSPFVQLAEGESGKLTKTFTMPGNAEKFMLEVFTGTSVNEIAFSVDNVFLSELPYVIISERPVNDRIFLEDVLTLSAETNVDADVIWTSSDTSVADIDGNGIVTLKSVGTTVVTATINYGGTEYEDSFTLTVLQTGIAVIGVPTAMREGDSAEASLEITGSVEGEIDISVDVENVVFVSVTGGETSPVLEISALGQGTATVTVRKGNYEVQFTVKVTGKYVITEGFETMTASGTGFIGDISNVNSSNNAVLALTDVAAEIPQGGGGKALRVSYPSGAANFYPGASVTMNQKLTVGAQYEFSATVRAISNVTQIFMKLESDNDKAANKTLTEGQTVTITYKTTVTKENPEILLFIISNAEHVDGEVFTIDNVTVTECAQIMITGLPANNAVNKQNGEYTLGYRFLGGATEGEVQWTSSDPEVASVDGGKVTPLKAGNTNITASSGEYTCTVTLTVTDPTALVYETFDEGFSVTGDSNVGWTGSRAGSAVTFTGTGFDMQCSPNEAHLPAGGSGNCLFFQPWDGSWAKLNFNNLPLEAGKKYEIGFKMRLINHNAALTVFRLFVTAGGATVTVPIEISGVGDTVDFSYIMDFTQYQDLGTTEIFLSIETTSGTQLALDNFSVYGI